MISGCSIFPLIWLLLVVVSALRAASPLEEGELQIIGARTALRPRCVFLDLQQRGLNVAHETRQGKFRLLAEEKAAAGRVRISFRRRVMPT